MPNRPKTLSEMESECHPTDYRAQAHFDVLRNRGVQTPCKQCGGLGTRCYGSTATWHGGLGGQAFTTDVCDRCWGSGDEHQHGADLRALTAKRADWEKDQCLKWLCRYLGLGFGEPHIDLLLTELSEFAKKQANRRKLPEGAEDFWWHRTCEAFASLLGKLRREVRGE